MVKTILNGFYCTKLFLPFHSTFLFMLSTTYTTHNIHWASLAYLQFYLNSTFLFFLFFVVVVIVIFAAKRITSCAFLWIFFPTLKLLVVLILRRNGREIILRQNGFMFLCSMWTVIYCFGGKFYSKIDWTKSWC